MQQYALACALLGLSPTGRLYTSYHTKSDAPTVYFMEKGHAMEFLEFSRDKKVIALFYGPGEFIVRCHPVLSNIQGLDDLVVNPFTHTDIFQMLRKFPESHHHYRGIRKLYRQKVQNRIHSLQTMTGQQRYQELVDTQPWVMDLAQPEDVASYLGVSVGQLKQLRG